MTAKSLNHLAFLAVIILSAPAVQAADSEGNKAYIVLNGGLYDDFADDLVLGGMIQIGYDLSKFFAIEGHFGLTAENDDDISGARVEKQLYHASVVVRGNLRGEDYAFFLFAGQSYLNLDYEIMSPGSGSGHKDETDLTYGIGTDLYGDENTAITVKWQRLIDIDGDKSKGEEDGEIDVIFVGITYYFGDARIPSWY